MGCGKMSKTDSSKFIREDRPSPYVPPPVKKAPSLANSFGSGFPVQSFGVSNSKSLYGPTLRYPAPVTSRNEPPSSVGNALLYYKKP
jgi:hypothetical protein